jgi:hypothetical protein
MRSRSPSQAPTATPRALQSVQLGLAKALPTRSQQSTQRAIYWSLRVAVAATFIGHGAFGIITKADWLPYFAVAGIPDWLAWRMEPLIGTMDISIGVLTLLNPRRGVLVWAVFWGFFTALLRPLAGQGIWEFFERAGNFGPPLAMLYLTGWGTNLTTWWRTTASPRAIEELNTTRLAWVPRLTTASLLVGHGGFGVVMQKQSWVHYMGALGIGPEAVQSASLIVLVGWLEVLLGVAVLLKPARGLLLAVVAWKLGTELLRVPAGEPIWEVVERGGSFGAPLALFFLTQWTIKNRRHAIEPAPSELQAELPICTASAA